MVFEILQQYCSLQEMPYFAIKQGVGGLLYDEVKTMSPCPLDEQGLMDLVGWMEEQHREWETQRKNITTLSHACETIGVEMMIFKGLALSQLYDDPESRKVGDVDAYFYEKRRTKDERLSAGDRMDELVRKGGQQVTPGWKHTSFDVRETHIENHRHFVGWDEHPRLKIVDDFLKSEISKSRNLEKTCLNQSATPSFEVSKFRSFEVSDIPGVKFANANFNTVLLPVHMGEHFVYEGASLRQLIDWAVFLEKCGDQVDWNTVYRLADEGGYRQWLDVLNAIAQDYFGVSKISNFRDFEVSSFPELEERVMKELAESKPFDREARAHHRLRYLWGRTRMAIRNRWKLRMVYDEATLPWYLRHGIHFLSEKWHATREVKSEK